MICIHPTIWPPRPDTRERVFPKGGVITPAGKITVNDIGTEKIIMSGRQCGNTARNTNIMVNYLKKHPDYVWDNEKKTMTITIRIVKQDKISAALGAGYYAHKGQLFKREMQWPKYPILQKLENIVDKMDEAVRGNK